METICAQNVVALIKDIADAADALKQCRDLSGAPIDLYKNIGNLRAWRDHLIGLSCTDIAVGRAPGDAL